MSRLQIAPHQPLPRGWNFGAHLRDGGWWLVGPDGRAIIADIDKELSPVAPADLKPTLMQRTIPEKRRK